MLASWCLGRPGTSPRSQLLGAVKKVGRASRVARCVCRSSTCHPHLRFLGSPECPGGTSIARRSTWGQGKSMICTPCSGVLRESCVLPPPPPALRPPSPGWVQALRGEEMFLVLQSVSTLCSGLQVVLPDPFARQLARFPHRCPKLMLPFHSSFPSLTFEVAGW